MEVRKCCGCGKTHPLTLEFFAKGKAYKGKPNFNYRCKVCTNAKNRERSLAKRLSSEKHKIKVREETTGLRVCKICGVEKALTVFNPSNYTLADGTKAITRKKYCNPCRQFKRNGGKPSKPKIGATQTLVEVKGETFKQCTTCKKSKKLEAFHSHKNAPTGYSYNCRGCSNEIKKRGYATNPQIRVKKREWDAKNKEKVRAINNIASKKYRSKPEKREIQAKARRRWEAKNPEKKLASSKKRAGEMTEAYITQLLCANVGRKRIPKSRWPEIPAELIEVKRAHLALQRAVKEAEDNK